MAWITMSSAISMSIEPSGCLDALHDSTATTAASASPSTAADVPRRIHLRHENLLPFTARLRAHARSLAPALLEAVPAPAAGLGSPCGLRDPAGVSEDSGLFLASRPARGFRYRVGDAGRPRDPRARG